MVQAQLAWTPEQYLEAWRREKRRERGGRRREGSSFEETVVEGDEEEEDEELIHVVADGEQMRRKGEGERKKRVKGKEGEEDTCTEGETITGEERRGGRVDSEVSRHSR